MRDRIALALLLLVGVEAAVWECFLVPLRPHGSGALIALLANLLVCRALRGVRSWGPGALAVGWLAVVLPLSGRGPLGDVVVPGTWWGDGFVIAGIAGVLLSLASPAGPGATPSGETRR